jgi:hypothetical protein
MLARHAVLLTGNPTKDFYPERPSGSEGSLLNPPMHLRLPPATPLESTLVDVFILSSLNLFRINTYEKQAGWGRGAIDEQPFHRSASRDELVYFQALAHSLVRPKIQLFYFQALPHSLPQNTGGGGVPNISPIRVFQLQSPGSARLAASPRALWVQKRQERMGSEVRE